MNQRKMEEKVSERLQASSESLADAIRVVDKRRIKRDEEIYAAYKLGYSMAEIAEASGMSKASIALAVRVQQALETRHD